MESSSSTEPMLITAFPLQSFLLSPLPLPGFLLPISADALPVSPSLGLEKCCLWELMHHHFLSCLRSLTFYFFLFSPSMFYLFKYSCSHLNGCAYKDKYVLLVTKSSFCPDLNLKVWKVSGWEQGRVLPSSLEP